MSDNTQLPQGTGGDVIRTVDRTLGSFAIPAKTQVVQIDAGGENCEALVTGASPLPVTSACMTDLLMAILVEQRITNRLLKEGLNTRDEIDLMQREERNLLSLGSATL